jgi:hypothetical protein
VGYPNWRKLRCTRHCTPFCVFHEIILQFRKVRANSFLPFWKIKAKSRKKCYEMCLQSFPLIFWTDFTWHPMNKSTSGKCGISTTLWHWAILIYAKEQNFSCWVGFEVLSGIDSKDSFFRDIASGHLVVVFCFTDFRTWRWRWYVPPKRLLMYGLQGSLFSQKMANFFICPVLNTVNLALFISKK